MSEERELKDMLYQEFARIGKCLSSPKRLEILDLLTQGPKSVELISKCTMMTVANVSQHLQTLHSAKLVKYKKKGNYVIYELADHAVLQFMSAFHDLSEKQLSQVQQIKREFMNESLHVHGISFAELQVKMENDEIVLVDVRPKEEYEESHIPGAVSIPIEELERKLATLPTNKEIVAYCRGIYCLLSVKAVHIMKEHGMAAFRLERSVYEYFQYVSSEK